MTSLTSNLRRDLERVVAEARDAAEEGAETALRVLAVDHHEPYPHMTPAERRLRNRLRARARQLGDSLDPRTGVKGIHHLVLECAYEYWHRMLFARFLAENDLLIEPELGVAISLGECEDMAREEGVDPWTLASRFAQEMLPQIFRPDDPLLQVIFAREHRLKLEQLLAALDAAVFTAGDALGWVYQFWQSRRKQEVNASGKKIGADELPAVTQLFTEPYMVSFLLDNSLGAWWAARRLTDDDLEDAEGEGDLRRAAALPGVPLEYLRFVKGDGGRWTPAAGTFDHWPAHLSGFKVLDPCCGSGHFLVAALRMLVPMRREMEGVSAREAVDRVLAENIHGLEIDRRCVELAAFALAFAAWRYPEAGGYRRLPGLHLACSGLSVEAAKDDWKGLAPDGDNLRLALDRLHDEFRSASMLGSLLDPTRSPAAKVVRWDRIEPMLAEALSKKGTGAQGTGNGLDSRRETGVAAHGLARAAALLAGRYHWIATNVPYLARGKQADGLREFCASMYPEAKNDLATVFLDRCLEFCTEGGNVSAVLPQNWLFLTSYRKFREKLLKNDTWHMLARLGPGAFETINGEVVKAILLSISRGWGRTGEEGLFAQKKQVDAQWIRGLDVSALKTARQKAELLVTGEIQEVEQEKQLENPDARVALENPMGFSLLSQYAECFAGVLNGDSPRFQRQFWELVERRDLWTFQQTTVIKNTPFCGLERVIFFDFKNGHLREDRKIRREKLHDSDQRGNRAWGKWGIGISQMNELPISLYIGSTFDSNLAVILPQAQNLILPIWTYCQTPEYHEQVRRIDQKVNVTNATLVKVPFDLEHWQKVAAEKYPDGLPEPYSDDPTQWIFHGHPCGSVVWDEGTHRTAIGPPRTDATVLQVAVARLLGYRWPAELDEEMELADFQRDWVRRCGALLPHADADGIVCISSIRGEDPAAERLRTLLAAAYGDGWSPAREKELIAATGSRAADLDDWLRNDFFEQHCKLFHHRPFIWHIWDSRGRDGFHVLVNYHRVVEGSGSSVNAVDTPSRSAVNHHKPAGGGGRGRKRLETLTYSYLGDWITRQKDGVKQGVGGAEDRLAAALELEKRLKAILEGEPPFDIFVRWKPLEEQPVGWDPDINDGVRLNIRPFMADDLPGGRRGAGILRWKPNISWEKDRGKDPVSSPWYHLFKGDRINARHLGLAEKRAAREERGRARGGGPVP